LSVFDIIKLGDTKHEAVEQLFSYLKSTHISTNPALGALKEIPNCSFPLEQVVPVATFVLEQEIIKGTVAFAELANDKEEFSIGE
jgi:hypothetical protein